MISRDEALKGLTLFGTAVLERLDRIIEAIGNRAPSVIEEDTEEPHEAPRTSVRRNGSTRRNESTARSIRTTSFDAYTTHNAAKVVRLLLREDVRPVGKVTRSIAEELKLSEPSTKRLINVLCEGLPFLILIRGGGSHTLRIKPSAIDQAEAWLRAIPTNETKQDFGAYSCSDAMYVKFAPAIVRTLLEGEKLTKDIYQIVGVRQNTFRGVMNRLLSEGFIAIPITPRGSAPMVRITDSDQARRWLATFMNTHAELM